MISKELVQSLKNGAVLVISDVMIDRYIEDDVVTVELVERLSTTLIIKNIKK